MHSAIEALDVNKAKVSAVCHFPAPLLLSLAFISVQAQLTIRSSCAVGRGAGKLRKRETSLVFNELSEMNNAIELIEHFRGLANASAR